MLTHVTETALPSTASPSFVSADNINQSLGIWLKAGVLIGKATLKVDCKQSFSTG